MAMFLHLCIWQMFISKATNTFDVFPGIELLIFSLLAMLYQLSNSNLVHHWLVLFVGDQKSQNQIQTILTLNSN